MVGRIGEMPVLLLFVFRFVRLLLSGHQAVAIENAALRMQIAAFQRKRKRRLLTTLDRMFWITLRSLWGDWRKPLLYVQPDTVVRWQRHPRTPAAHNARRSFNSGPVSLPFTRAITRLRTSAE